MVSGDANYCEIKQRTFTDEQICRTNKCRDFELNPTDSLTGRTYKPRSPKFEQLFLTEVPE
jgi:hypothetical protein